MVFASNSTIGLDLGTTGLRAVELGRCEGRPVVERWAAMDFAEEVDEWLQVDPVEMGAVIRQALDGKGLRGRWVAHAVSGEAVAPQYFNFPQLMPEDIRETVRIEVEAGLPFRVEQALIDYILFPEQRPAPNKVRTHGIAIAADGTLVESRLNAIRRAKLEPFSVETDAVACANAFIATAKRMPDEGATAVLNIGRRYSNLALLGGEGTLLVRDLPWAGTHMTQAIADVLGVKAEEAERLKRLHWEKGPDAAEPLSGRMAETLDMATEDLANRLRDTIHYWVAERLVPGLGQIFLTGGGSLVRGLPERLAEAMSAPVEPWSPLVEGVPTEEERRAPWTYRMSVAFGLALRDFSKAKG